MDVEKEIYALREEMEKLGKEISEARKQGKDTKIAELILMGLTPKINYAELSEDSIDINSVKKQLAKIRSELDNAVER